MFDYDLENKIRSIELSYLFARNLDHGVSQEGEWKLFEPSKFIYSFFALNMIYEINWKNTLKSQKKLWYHQSVKTHTKLYFLIEFIYSSSEFIDFHTEYKEFGSLISLIKNSQKIKSDPNITRINNCEKLSNKESFLNNYIMSISNLNYDNFGVDDHYNLLAFTYQIRNNIFHGEKTAGMMTLKDQRERLVDYTNVVLVTLELFFNVLDKDFDYYRANNYELSDNINRA